MFLVHPAPPPPPPPRRAVLLFFSSVPSSILRNPFLSPQPTEVICLPTAGVLLSLTLSQSLHCPFQACFCKRGEVWLPCIMREFLEPLDYLLLYPIRKSKLPIRPCNKVPFIFYSNDVQQLSRTPCNLDTVFILHSRSLLS